MADIKAKDISVAQSIASSDLILGSSIAGTTANVTVETVGKHIIEQLPISSLNNISVEQYLNSRTQILTYTGRSPGNSKPVYFVKFGCIVVAFSSDDLREPLNAGTTKFIELPTAFRPSRHTYGFFGNFVDAHNFYVYVLNDGLYIYTPLNLSADARNFAFTIIYTTTSS